MEKTRKTQKINKTKKGVFNKTSKLIKNFASMLLLVLVVALFIVPFANAATVRVQDGALNISNNLLVDTNTLYVNSVSGLVGIGTTSPGEELDVSGDIRTNGSLYQPVYGSDDGLIFYMPFNAPNGSIQYDRSPYGNDVTQHDSTNCNATLGKYGAGCEFDGTDDYADAPDNDLFTFSNKPFSVEAWIKADTIGAYESIAGKWDNNNQREWLFRFGASNDFEFRLIDETLEGSRGRDTTQTLSAGIWHHLVGTHDGSVSDPNGGTKIYINGIRADTTDITAGDYGGMRNQNGRLYFGAVEDTAVGASLFFDGIIDEVKIYNKVLTEEEIRAHYLRGNDYVIGAITADKFRVVNTSGNVNFMVDAKGYIGINTTNPLSPLHIKHEASNPPTDQINDMHLRLEDQRGYADASTNITIGFIADDGEYAYISAERPANNDISLVFGFRTSTYQPYVERMRIDDSGNIGIGTTSPNATLTVKTSGTTIADEWTVRSDRNLKDEIADYAALNILDAPLQIYTYKLKYKEPIYGVNENNETEIIGYEDKLTKQHLGIMADEAPKELLGEDGKSIDLYAYVSYVYAYAQELKKENELLKARVEVLENK